jgi:ABC-type Fe3+ transport system substrate-binding protein
MTGLPNIRTVMAGLALGAAFASSALAQDRALIDAAKKEGAVTWYTTQIINQFARPAAEAFEKKYGIKVDYVRADSNQVALRIVSESKAGRPIVDVFDGTTVTPVLKKEGLVEKWIPESAKRFGPEYYDKDGYWLATNLYVLTPGYNTSLVPKGQEPKTWNDLLDPKWKGKMAWNSSSSTSAGPGFIGLVLAEMGQEKGMAYIQALSKQNIAGLKVAARQVLDQVIAGEYPIALEIFNNHAVISAQQGAPVNWIPMNPSLAVLSVLSIIKNAPHPNAAKLLVEFLASEEGQKLYRDADYMPVDPNVPPRDPSLRPDGKNFRAIYMTPEQVQDAMPRWTDIYKQYFN